MKVLIIVLIGFMLVSFYPQTEEVNYLIEVEVQHKFILIKNGNPEAIGVTIWYSGIRGWEEVEQMHIPAGSSKTFLIGNGRFSSYGYTTTRNLNIQRFYSSEQTVY